MGELRTTAVNGDVSHLHCWEDGPRTEDDCGTSCLLSAGHGGECEWTRDDEIMITFQAPNPGRSAVT